MMRSINFNTKYFNIQVIIFLQLLNTLARCSRVIDSHDNSQNNLYVSDYCPKIGGCDDGTHVACLYYDPERIMGPTCHSVANISITPEYARIFLIIMNKIRSKVAKGTMKGKNDILLPRGYGLYRLEWDEELATFAQLWANQCILSRDVCHATKNFSDPGQTLGLIRFTIDDWEPISTPDFPASSTLTRDKLKYAIVKVIEAWYSLKSLITAEHIKHLGIGMNQLPYLVHGNVTHIGCGISAYREYTFHKNKANSTYNSVQIVCNYSTRVHKGFPVYNTDPPTQPGYTVQCGCPPGYDEDGDCLCYRSGRMPMCKVEKPNVAVMPIFEMEKAPMATPVSAVSKFPLDVKSRYFGLNPKLLNVNPSDVSHQNMIHSKYDTIHSLFTKSPMFELPMRGKKHTSQKNNMLYKKDVPPRKDFTKSQLLVSKYMENQRKHSVYYKKTTESKNDTSVMKLLDKLESEIKHINFDTNSKNAFDQKLSKIYKYLIGEPNWLENKNTMFEIPYNDSDIIKKYNQLLENNVLYNKDQMNFDKKHTQTSKHYKHNNNNTEVINDFNRRRKEENNTMTEDSWYYNNEDDFPLNVNRRRFYENKLLYLQRKLDSVKRKRHRHGDERRVKTLRLTQTTEAFPYKRTKEPINTFYMPDRARFLNGF